MSPEGLPIMHWPGLAWGFSADVTLVWLLPAWHSHVSMCKDEKGRLPTSSTDIEYQQRDCLTY